ncbi:hypothetical protein C8J57DRAFT_1210257 [Mycena rebaudengoi]|nr:hypothetical protein C8J57DRAFT_1210257 [Mycena rebaudengoi]
MLPLLSKLSRGFRPPLAHDGLLMKSLSTLLVVHSLYTYFVTNFGDLAADALILWSYLLEYSVVTMVTITAQWQLLCLANLDRRGLIVLVNHTLICFPTAVHSSSHLPPSVTSLREIIYYGSPLSLPTTDLFVDKIISSKCSTMCAPVQITASACDISITLALIWYLRSKKSPSGWRSIAKIIDTLILYAVCRGILTASTLILYVNPVVASLNARKVVAGIGESEVYISSRLQFSHSTGRGGSATPTMPLAFMRPKTESNGSLGQGDTIGSFDR